MKTKKTTAILLCAAMLASAWSNGAVQAAAIVEPAATEGLPLLHAPAAEDLQAGMDWMATASDGVSAYAAKAALPASYDLRTKGLVSSVKHQGSYGTCWSFATMGSLESGFITEQPGIDLSEWYVANYHSSEAFGTGTMDLQEGATIPDVIGLLTNWIGAVSEAVAPYDTPYETATSRKEVQQQAEYHVTGVHFLPCNVENYNFSEQLRNVKQAIVEGHSLYFSTNFDDTAYYNYNTNAFYNSGELPATDPTKNYSHAMLIVGYDDTYSASNFLSPPDMDGAWLVKNSWGEQFGDNGYLWISYADPMISNILYFDAEYAEAHDDLYAYDDYGSAGVFAVNQNGDKTVYFSNVFQAEKDSFLTDVMVNCGIVDDACEITIYTGLEDAANPVSGTPGGTTSTILTHLGYQMISLDTPVALTAGESFSVVVKMTGEQGYHIPCEYSYYNDGEAAGYGQYSEIDGYLMNGFLMTPEHILATFDQNQSFYSVNGKDWTDFYDAFQADHTFITGNVCVKALTTDAGKVQFSSYAQSVPQGTEISLSCCEDAEIYYSINGSEVQAYTEPFTITEETSVFAYVAGTEEMVYKKHYNLKKAELSSLLVKTGWSGSYADVSHDGEILMEIPIYVDEMSLLPMTTGTITDGENFYSSNTEIPILLETGLTPTRFRLSVEQEGLESSTYAFVFQRACEPFGAGVWKPTEERALYFFDEDGVHGIKKERTDGSERSFTYTIGDNLLTMVFEDGTECSYPIACDGEEAIVYLEDGSTEEWVWLDQGQLEDYAFYTNQQLEEMARNFYQKQTGTEPVECSAQFCMDWRLVKITLVSSDNAIVTYTVDWQTGIGEDQEENIVDITQTPSENAASDFKTGIWERRGEDGRLQGYCYINNKTKEYTYISLSDKGETQLFYDLQNHKMELGMEDYIIDKMYITFTEETIAFVSFFSGERALLTYLEDSTPESFQFYCCYDLFDMATIYYEALTGMPVLFLSYAENQDGTVTLYSMDDSIAYTVNHITATGVDSNGKPVDLTNPTYTEGEKMKPGIWFGTGRAAGYYCFTEEETVRFRPYDMYGDTEDTLFDYRIVDGNGVAQFEDASLHFQYLPEADGDKVVWKWNEADYQCTETMVYLQEGTFETAHLLTMKDMYEMAKTYYAIHHDGKDSIATQGYVDESGMVYIGVIHVTMKDGYEVLEEVLDEYTVDSLTGKGTNLAGMSIDLLHPEEEEYYYSFGDLNGDEMIAVEDAVTVLTYYAQQSAGLEPVFSEEENKNAGLFRAADVNGDAVVSVEDAVLILTYYAQQSAGLQPTWDKIL